MQNEMADRLEKVESILAHLERQYEQLNGVVVEQGKALSRLQAHLQRLGQTLEDGERERIQSTNPKPPHYQ